jgi:hypothetical protein
MIRIARIRRIDPRICYDADGYCRKTFVAGRAETKAMKLDEELGNLRIADEHIARGRNLIEQQLETVHKLKLRGDDPDSAITLLRELRLSLEAMMEHRAVIEETIAMIRSVESR